MAVNNVTAGSAIAIQSSKESPPVPSIGELPAQSTSEEIEIKPAQNDVLFVRESIGSAIVEDRLDNEEQGESISLIECSNKNSSKFGLSIERPVAIASFDVFSRFSRNESLRSTEELISKNLEIVEFENNLLQSDYDFLINKIEESNKDILKELNNSLKEESRKTKESLDALTKISTSADEISKNLDFSRSESSFSKKAESFLTSYNARFDESTPSIDSIISSNIRDTSTSRIISLNDQIKKTNISKAESDLLVRLSSEGTVFSNYKTPNSQRYSGSNYDGLSSLEKVIVCCKVLSRVMSDTFTKLKFGNVSNDSLPVSFGNSRFGNSSYIFESNNVRVSSENDTQDLASRLSGRSAAISVDFGAIDTNSFAEGSSKKNNNFDSIISKIIRGERSQLLNEFEKAQSNFENAKNYLRHKNATGFSSEACSPQDILLTVFEEISNCFPTYKTATEPDSLVNINEFIDAVIMTIGCKNPQANTGFAALYRSVVLTSILDEEYEFLSGDPEEFDNTSETKSTTNVDGEEKTIRTNSGTSSKGKGKVSSTSSATDDYYEPLRKRGLIPPVSNNFIKQYLSKIRDADLTGNAVLTADMFFYSTLKEQKNLKTVQYDSLVKGKMPVNVSSFTAPQLPATVSISTDGGVVTSHVISLFLDRLKKYGKSESKLTIKSSISRLYAKILNRFKSSYNIEEIDEASFQINGKNKGKSAVFDLIFECISNCIIWSVNPAMSLDPETGKIYVFSSNLTKFSIRTNGSSATALSLYESIRLLKFMKDCSTARGSFSRFVFSSDKRYYDITNLSILRPTISRLQVIADDPSSNYTQSVLTFSSAFVDLTKPYRESLKNLVIIDSLNQILTESVVKLKQNRQKLSDAKALLLSLSDQQKLDVFKCLSFESITSAHLKQVKRTLTSANHEFENFYEKNQISFDTSATKWFYKQYPFDVYERSRIIFFGLPQDFTSNLIRQERELNSDTFKILEENVVPNSTPKYFEVLSGLRPVQKSSLYYEFIFGQFHPYIHVIQKEQINVERDVRVSLRSRFDLFFFDKEKAKVVKLNPASQFDCEIIQSKLGLPSLAKVKEIIDFHIQSSILSSVVRITSGIDIDFDTLGTFKRCMSVEDANKVLGIISSNAVIPRGSMSAKDFLSPNADGLIEPVLYSDLQGNSPDLTNPSDHALLLKFLKTQAFNKASLQKEILIPSSFERIYCCFFDNNSITDTSKNQYVAKMLNINQLFVSAIR